jgi:hypothetical protein
MEYSATPHSTPRNYRASPPRWVSIVGEVLTVPFPRPRARAAVLGHPDDHACRRRVIDFLDHHAHQSRPSALDDVRHRRIG